MMNIYLSKIKKALEKDLVLVYLKDHSDDFNNILEIKQNAFNSQIQFEIIRQYAEELKNDNLVAGTGNPSEIKYINDPTFIETGGHVKRLFIAEGLSSSPASLIVEHHKDLILYYLKHKKENCVTDLNEIGKLFQLTGANKIEYYITELGKDGHITLMNNNIDVFRYYPSSDTFIEEGGYVGIYLQERIRKDKLKEINKPKDISPEELLSKQRIDKKKDYIDKVRTNLIYYLLKYGIFILIGFIVILIVSIRFGLITKENAISFITWLIDRIKP